MAYDLLLNAVKIAGQKYNLPPKAKALMMAVAETESNFNLNAQGPRIGIDVKGDNAHYGKRARGPFQFMPATAAAYGLKDPTDPIQAADATARHLLKAYKLQGNDWLKAAVGHHSGPAWKSLGKYGKDYQQKLTKRMGKYLDQVGGTPEPTITGPVASGAGAQPVQGGMQMTPEMMQALLGGSSGSILGDEPFLGGIIGQTGRAISSLSQPMIYGRQAIPNFGEAMNKQQILSQRDEELKQRKIERTQDMIGSLLGGGSKPSTLEKQLQAAGLKPGTPEYQAAIMDYLTKKDGGTTVNVGGEATGPTAPEGGNWVKEGDASKGYYTLDETGTPSAIKFLPGTKQPTQEQTKWEGQLGIEKQLVEGIGSFIASDKADKLFDLSGKATELMQSDSWLTAAARGIIPDGLLQTAGFDPNDPDIAEVMGQLSELTNVTLNRISGAAVSPEEGERLKKQLPALGQSREMFKANYKRTLANLEYLAELQKERQGLTTSTTTAPATSPTTAPADGTSKKDAIMKRWGL